ncbi:MAG TPA: serine hydrolase domain-containing protein [Asanoa sp.]|nr:serine hydrolase domain-containing protein [Asanoa sp.]
MKALDRLVRETQAQARIPALAAAVHRADRPLWTLTVGAEPDAAFRIGSVTKTFTAVLVMQARDEGLLDLDDPIGRHLDVPALGELTVRRLLSHTSGIQREPYGDVWDTLIAPDAATLVADLERAERVLPAARRFHYSNLGVALLGLTVARMRGGTWAEVLADRVLGPLGLAGTSAVRPAGATTGYLVDAYSDAAFPEPPLDFGAVGPAAQLWSTAADMAKWAAFLADPATVDPSGAVLAEATLDEMRWPLTTTDQAIWSAGFGLGLILVPRGDRVVHVGHDGAMPGFLAGVYGRPRALTGDLGPAGFGAAVLGASGTALETVDLPHQLLTAAVEADPAEIVPWTPGEPVPDAYRSVVGRWWSEGFEQVFGWYGGALRAKGAADPAGKPPAVFRPSADNPDILRTVSGREVGELLRLTRDGEGRVVRMHWATYRLTRDQQTFEGRSFSA